MSYDLFFTRPAVTFEQFSDYFRGREHYSVDNSRASYANEDTGVYFSFAHSDEPEEDPESPGGNVAFNLNFFRPHYFALEAEPEVHSAVDHFAFQIHDPQIHGMNNGPYSREGFIAGWNSGNEFGYQAIMNSNQPPEVIHSRPRDELESIWQWNYAKKQVQDRLRDVVFVPRIVFVQIEDAVHSAAVWPDAIPTLIPQVDSILIPRQEFAPRRLFKKKDDLCILRFSEALHLLKPFESTDYSLPAYLLSYTKPPIQVAALVKALRPQRASMQGIPMDRVLNRELVEQYRKG